MTGSSRSGVFPRRASGRRGAAIGLGGRLQRLGDERLGASARTTAIADATGARTEVGGVVLPHGLCFGVGSGCRSASYRFEKIDYGRVKLWSRFTGGPSSNQPAVKE